MLRGYNDFESKFPELAKEWSPKNEPLRPSMITAATHRKVIWQCKLGHEWTASVKSRTVNGTGCPYCSHNFVLPGFNDLTSRFPEIAAEWSERNLPLTPDQVTAFKNIKVWWKCRLGHEWNTLISTRAGGSQCPYCSGIKLLKGFNDLKTKYPSLAAEWSEKNLPLTPDAVNEKSTKNVWWKCNTCGYEWKAVVKARVKGGMCPVCAERAVLQGYNDLGTIDPHLLSEWDYEKNSKWTPSNVSKNSMKVVWWKCGVGHSYRAKITDRTIEQKGCPQCEAEFQQALPQMLIMMYMPDLSTTKDTQMTLRVENTITGEAIIQETKNIELHSVYDYKNYSDEFGIIQNDNILAWMTPETDGILQVRRNAVSWLEQSFGTEYGMLPGYQPAYGFTSDQGAYITYYQVAAIQSAISSMGVRYNMGPYSFSASQRVLMPDAVLENGSGICIETAVLMASVLESASMHAMIVFTPGHAQTAVETWSGSGQYFLIETTMLPFTATQDALQSLIQPLSAEEWANYLYNKEQEAQQSGGMVYVVDCDLAPVLNIQGLNY